MIHEPLWIVFGLFRAFFVEKQVILDVMKPVARVEVSHEGGAFASPES